MTKIQLVRQRGASEAVRREEACCDQRPCLRRNRCARSSGAAVHRINSASWRGMQIKERFLVHAPLDYTWNHSRWTRLSRFTTIGGKPVADHVRPLLENEIRAGEREAAQIKSEKSEVQDTPHSDEKVENPCWFSINCLPSPFQALFRPFFCFFCYVYCV